MRWSRDLEASFDTNQDRLYDLFLRRDAAFNGRFLTGVLTTGIYCLPSCPARRPLRQNVRFFRTPDEAVRTGLRPCRRCRPDSFYRGEEWHENLFEQTVLRVRKNPAEIADVAALCKAAGLSRTALNDLFRVHAQESPAAFLRRNRVAHAALLLEEGARPLDAASAAGFGSTSAFHQQFAGAMAMTPAAYAGLTNPFLLALPKDFRPDEVLAFHGRDPEGVSERVSGATIRKCAGRGIIEIELSGAAARCTFEGLAPYDAHRLALRLLGLGYDIATAQRELSRDPVLATLIAKRPGLRIPLAATPWEGLAWAIIGQQIGLGFAIKMRRNLIILAGAKHSSGMLGHPKPAVVAALDIADLRRLQFSQSKAEYLLSAARTIATGGLDLDGLRQLSAPHAARLLRDLKGVGLWTIDYVFLRALGFHDSLPAGDAGIAQAWERLTGVRPSEKQLRAATDKFAPHRSLAAAHLWASLHE